MKQKDFCQECGRLFCKKKLRKSQKDKRLLCGNCYRLENRQRNGFTKSDKPLIPKLDNISEKRKKELRIAKIRKKCNYIDRSDVDFLKDKYGYGNYNQIDKLRKHLGITRMNDILDNSESIDRQKRECNLNKRFMEGLK